MKKRSIFPFFNTLTSPLLKYTEKKAISVLCFQIIVCNLVRMLKFLLIDLCTYLEKE